LQGEGGGWKFVHAPSPSFPRRRESIPSMTVPEPQGKPTALQSLISGQILVMREQRVMLDSDLAELYGVQTKVLVQAIKRNALRFPQDFMFQLSKEEFMAMVDKCLNEDA